MASMLITMGLLPALADEGDEDVSLGDNANGDAIAKIGICAKGITHFGLHTAS